MSRKAVSRLGAARSDGEGASPAKSVHDGDRQMVSTLACVPDGFYLRSTATWNFELENRDYSIPVGFSIGKVTPVRDKVAMNAFIEPECTVASEGAGAPKWQIFTGVNFQFAVGK